MQSLAGNGYGGGLDNQGNLTLTGDLIVDNTAVGGYGSVGSPANYGAGLAAALPMMQSFHHR